MYIRAHNIIYIQIIQEQMTQMGKDTLPHLYSSIKKWLEMSRVYVCFYSAACCCRSLRCAKRPLFAFVAPEILARPTFLTLVRIFDVSRCGEHMVFSSAVAEKPWHVKRQKDAVVSSAKFHGFWRWIQLSFDVCSRILWWSSSFSNHQEQPSLQNVPWPWIDQHPWCSIRAPLCLGSYETFASLVVFSGVFHFRNRNWMMIPNDFPIFQGFLFFREVAQSPTTHTSAVICKPLLQILQVFQPAEASQANGRGLARDF